VGNTIFLGRGNPVERNNKEVMQKAILIIAVLYLSACSSAQNTEGKILDASSGYCQDIRIENPELYYETCESTGGWKARDPKGYKRVHEEKSVASEIVGGIIEVATEEALNAITE
jgi:hypothetical protein